MASDEGVGALDAEQQAVVLAPLLAAMLVLAGAGSGKTRTLLARSAALLQQGCSVRIFSHSNNAVDELVRRLPLAGASAPVAVTTMHSYAASQLQRHGCVDVAACDFDACLLRYVELLEQGDLSCEETDLLVDEAQDLSAVQNRIVRALQAQGVRVGMMGDAEQAIFSFQNSSPAHLLRFGRELPVAHRFELPTNYRARNLLLVDFANALAARDIRAGYAVQMRPSPRAVPGRVPRLRGYDKSLEAALVEEVRWCGALDEQAGDERGSICVLGHTERQLDRAHVALMEQQLPAVLYSNKRSGEFRRLRPQLLACGVVQLLTIWGAKGSEFDHVILLSGQDRGDADERDDESGSSESRRLLYVACTRGRRTLTILCPEKLSRGGPQPCRWLTTVWSLLDVLRLEPYAGEQGAEWLSLPTVGVTEVMRNGGGLGLLDYYGATSHEEIGQLYSSCAVQLALDEEPDELPPQVPSAYGFGLELYVGRLFELHAMLVFGAAGVRALADEVLQQVGRINVNREVYAMGTSLIGGEWWRRNGGALLQHLVAGLQATLGNQRVTAAVDMAALLTMVPQEFRSAVVRALTPANVLFKFKGYHCALQIMLSRLVVVAERTALDPSTLPDFPSIFRRYDRTWDGSEEPLMALRPTFDEAVRATQEVARGKFGEDKVALFAALEAFWQAASERGTPGGKQALLHLAQRRDSAVHLAVGQLRLNASGASLLQADARRVMQLLGHPWGAQTPCAVTFRCCGRAYEGGQAAEELSVEASVIGRADVLFSAGCLEIKAVKGRLDYEHAAQALWYPTALRLPRTYLWDLYRRRLLVWATPEGAERDVFLTACLLRYLQSNAPPGQRERAWPQRVVIQAETAAAV